MSGVKWIKLQVDIFDNRKIRQIRAMPSGNEILLMWFQLMCLAGTINDDGKIYITPEIPYTEKTMSTEFGIPIDTVKLGLTVFQEFGMIDIVDNFLMLSSWSKYQSVDGMEKIREQGRLRTARYRERKKLELHGDVTRDVTATQCDALEREEEKELDKSNNLSNSSNNKILNNKENIYCSEPKVDSEPEVAFLPLNDDSEFGIKQSVFKEWQKLYPAVDVMQELNKMRGWCLANPSKRKTKKGIMRFINNWLSKEQDKGGTPGYKPSPSSQAIGRPSRGQKKMKQIKDENGYNKWVEDTDGS